ncbi:MAG: hypothetical protein HW380_490 [Magnetococcales bacterium]|nr:hypothetical protein [Magnetococcales bacterium]
MSNHPSKTNLHRFKGLFRVSDLPIEHPTEQSCHAIMVLSHGCSLCKLKLTYFSLIGLLERLLRNNRTRGTPGGCPPLTPAMVIANLQKKHLSVDDFFGTFFNLLNGVGQTNFHPRRGHRLDKKFAPLRTRPESHASFLEFP